MIDEIHLLLKGKTSSLIQALKQRMILFSEKYAFEEAHKIKITIEQIEKYRAKSTIVSPTISDLDVFTFSNEKDSFFINYLVIQEGAIIHGYTSEIKKKLEESTSDMVNFVLPELREKFESKSKEVLVQQSFEDLFSDFRYTVPMRGDRKELLDLSLRNLIYYKKDKLKQEKIINPEKHTERILEQLRKDFRLKDLPIHMECFDNSNLQGTNAVSACVVFKDAKPSKKDYRHFNIKSVEGPNDFASMTEVVTRRYKRLLEENQSLPQLVIIDGGKGQLSAALEAFDKLGIRGKIAVVGIAKKLEEIFFPGDQYPMYLDKRSESLKIIQFMRNEAHRFGITHHRDKRSKSAIESELENIPGIGPKTIVMLLQQFKSVNAVKNASFESLKKVIGEAKANQLIGFYKKN